MKVVFAVVLYAMVVQGAFSRPHSTPSTAVRHDQLSFAFFDFLVESEPSDSATAQRAATEYDDLDTFFRKLQAGRSGTESFIDGQLRGSGLLDDVKENKDFTKVINTDMALPRSYAVVGPRGWSSRGSDGGKSGGGDDHDDDAYYYYHDYDYGSKGNKGGKSSRGRQNYDRIRCNLSTWLTMQQCSTPLTQARLLHVLANPSGLYEAFRMPKDRYRPRMARHFHFDHAQDDQYATYLLLRSHISSIEEVWAITPNDDKGQKKKRKMESNMKNATTKTKSQAKLAAAKYLTCIVEEKMRVSKSDHESTFTILA